MRNRLADFEFGHSGSRLRREHCFPPFKIVCRQASSVLDLLTEFFDASFPGSPGQFLANLVPESHSGCRPLRGCGRRHGLDPETVLEHRPWPAQDSAEVRIARRHSSRNPHLAADRGYFLPDRRRHRARRDWRRVHGVSGLRDRRHRLSRRQPCGDHRCSRRLFLLDAPA